MENPSIEWVNPRWLLDLFLGSVLKCMTRNGNENEFLVTLNICPLYYVSGTLKIEQNRGKGLNPFRKRNLHCLGMTTTSVQALFYVELRGLHQWWLAIHSCWIDSEPVLTGAESVFP